VPEDTRRLKEELHHVIDTELKKYASYQGLFINCILFQFRINDMVYLSFSRRVSSAPSPGVHWFVKDDLNRSPVEQAASGIGQNYPIVGNGDRNTGICFSMATRKARFEPADVGRVVSRNSPSGKIPGFFRLQRFMEFFTVLNCF